MKLGKTINPSARQQEADSLPEAINGDAKVREEFYNSMPKVSDFKL